MHLSYITSFALSTTACIASAQPFITKSENAHVTRDAPVYQKAWADLGNAYKALDTSFKTINANLLKPIVSSTIPQTHQKLIDLLQAEANYIRSTNEKLGYAETMSLIVPAQTLSTTISSTLRTVESVKALSVRSGERAQLQQMLRQQSEIYSAWEGTLNKLVPVGQQSVAHFFSNEATQAYSRALRLYNTD